MPTLLGALRSTTNAVLDPLFGAIVTLQDGSPGGFDSGEPGRALSGVVPVVTSAPMVSINIVTTVVTAIVDPPPPINTSCPPSDNTECENNVQCKNNTKCKDNNVCEDNSVCADNYACKDNVTCVPKDDDLESGDDAVTTSWW
jgi:hypothetical protein